MGFNLESKGDTFFTSVFFGREFSADTIDFDKNASVWKNKKILFVSLWLIIDLLFDIEQCLSDFGKIEIFKNKFIYARINCVRNIWKEIIVTCE